MTDAKQHKHHKKERSPLPRTLVATRYLVLIPIVGLALSAAMLFIFGGINLIKLLYETTLVYLGLAHAHQSDIPIYVEIVEYVHTFLIGTVLYITSVGFFQLFIKKVNFPRWLRITNTEELETNLIGVTVVVLAINFMALSFNKNGDYLVRYGVGIALPIAALGLFLGMRAWAKKMDRDSELKEKELDERLKQIEKASKEEARTE
jgi:uncharacterized membrane protein YqhA